MTTAWHAGLAPVSLTELVEAAGLQTRTDRKYVLPAGSGSELLGLIGPRARVLEIGGRRELGYESTYFDTPDLASFRGAAYDRRRRFKLRTRTYLDTGTCWFEVKLRGRRGATVKERVTHPPQQRHGLTRESAELTTGLLAAAFIDGVDTDELRPTLHTAYHRTTLLLPDQRTRVTVDTGLVWQSARGERRDAGEVLVVETKTVPGAADALDHRLWSAGHRPVRLSKYATGMTLVQPDLSGNRWHSVRSRSLGSVVEL